VSFGKIGTASSALNPMYMNDISHLRQAMEIGATPSTPHIFAAIFTGCVLAIAFQLLLTHLAVALGISAFAELDDSAESSGDNPSTLEDSARKFGIGFFLWAIASGSIALFFAAWFGVELSQTVDAETGMVIGLSIWALSYLSLLKLEISLVGSLLFAATAGVSSVLGGSKPKQGSKSTSDKVVRAAQVASIVREEMRQGDDRSSEIEKGQGVKSQLKKFFGNLDLAELDRDKLQAELSKLGTAKLEDWKQVEAEFREFLDAQEGGLAGFLTDQGASSERVQELTDWVKQSFAHVKRSLPDRGATEGLRSYLDGLHDADFDLDEFKAKLVEHFDDSSASIEDMLTRLELMDREYIESVLGEYELGDKEEEGSLVTHIEGTRDEVKARVESAKQEIERRLVELKEKGLEVAEAGRRRLAQLAWWAFAVACSSAAAAALGGLLGVSSQPI